jgi:minor histocompatibility antigen H13
MLDLLMQLDIDAGIAITYTAIILMALFPIWVGSFRSLDQTVVETLSAQDAYMFPVIGSCVLFGLYLLFKFFSKDWVNLLLMSYFLIFGVLAVSATIRPLVRQFLPKSASKNKHKIRIPLFWREPFVVKWTVLDLMSLLVGLGIGAWYMSTKHWVANNILGISFSIQGVSFISLGSYQIGCILLSGLFVYDIFWVFGTDVMVSVARSFDAPVKLLFPKDIFASEMQFSMLGLGDIVIPGIFIALMLRFDAKRAGSITKFGKPYFSFTFGGYILGMVTTIAVMHVFQAAQPALLYLVPFCIASSLFPALLLGEFKELLLFNEASQAEKGKKQKKGPKGNKGKSK